MVNEQKRGIKYDTITEGDGRSFIVVDMEDLQKFREERKKSMSSFVIRNDLPKQNLIGMTNYQPHMNSMPANHKPEITEKILCQYFQRQHSAMPRLEAYELRESLAIKPDEIYKLGQNPIREAQLKVLTDILFNTAKAETPK